MLRWNICVWTCLVVMTAKLSWSACAQGIKGMPTPGREHGTQPKSDMSKTGNKEKLPPWLPRYYLDVRLDVSHHTAKVHMCVTWTNRHQRPANELVFNVHSHYKVPDDQVGYLAKTLELLRMDPQEALDTVGHACQIDKVTLGNRELPFHFRQDILTALVVPLPAPVAQKESVTIEIDFTMKLPQKQGRWGQWNGVTFLSNWVPVAAVYDDQGWHPIPFIPWHQPFFNESGIYQVRVIMPEDQKVACSGSITAIREVGRGLKQVDIMAEGVRDFAFLCSARYQEYAATVKNGAGPEVVLRCLAFPEHEHYAREMLRIAADVIPVYGRWFGAYPYPEFTIAESYFGWNGNECSSLIMIDERVFAMPHLASGYVEYLVSHEICHQWWYNLVGTNGYCETWMDEAMATYFSHRYLNQKHGKQTEMLHYPRGLGWLPNIHRDTYHLYSMYGTLGRGEASPILQELPKFSHLINLFSMCYDKGSKVVGMIEDRLGEAAFLDFVRLIQARYRYRILRVADFQRELEEYTGKSWEEFFQRWLREAGMSDWSVEKVELTPLGKGRPTRWWKPEFLEVLRPKPEGEGRYKAIVLLHQKAEYNEQTVLGFSLDGTDNYQIRVPILPGSPVLELEEPPCRIESLPNNRVRVEIVLPCRPTQISVDPDHVLPDKNPANNHWITPVKVRFTPLYTLLDETDITTAYDRWNVTVGPWVWSPAYNDPWFTRSTITGLRAGGYRTQEFVGGAYVGYRTDNSDIVAGVDALWDHFPWPRTQLGLIAEKSLLGIGDDPTQTNRVSVFGRYIMQYGSSLYLPPMEYVELFTSYTDKTLPMPNTIIPGSDPFESRTTVGLHYRLDYLTPYWDPQGGYRLDVVYAEGLPLLGEQQSFHAISGQFSCIMALPDLHGWLQGVPGVESLAEPPLRWLSQTRLAARVYGAAGLPNNADLFTLGGSGRFRGFDLADRQGNLVWIGSLEWRVPIARRLTASCLDHVVGLRNVQAIAFYDIGDAYVNNRSYGPVAHAFGAGIAFDLAWFAFVERTCLRFDIAKTINADTPVMFWFGIQQPF